MAAGEHLQVLGEADPQRLHPPGANRPRLTGCIHELLDFLNLIDEYIVKSDRYCQK